MRLSQAVIAYFFIGAVMFGGGAIPFDEAGLTGVFLEQEADGDITANDGAIAGDDGMLNNLIGPVRNALGTIAGGELLAAFGAIDKLLGYFAWPVTVMQYHDAPNEVVLLSGGLVASFVMAVLRVFRASI